MRAMVLILDGNSEIGAHVRNKLCFRHLIRSRAVSNLISLPKTPIYLHACATCSGFSPNISLMLWADILLIISKEKKIWLFLAFL